MAHILIIEDDQDLRFLYQTALVQSGHEASGAANATDAKVMLENDDFDLVMLDLNMPDAHGTAIIDHLQANPALAKLPVVVVTANDHWLDDVFERGVTEILVKPVSMADIIKRVNFLLG